MAITRSRRLLALFAAFLICFSAHAHSGKARFHAIIDTDAAADDLRTICMLLGNREVEVLAVTTSEGALLPAPAAVKVAALLDDFHHEGVPVAAGRAVNAPVPAWRAHSAKVEWGGAASDLRRDELSAKALIIKTLEEEDEKVTFIALGALTNLYDVLVRQPELAGRIEQVIWYSSGAEPLYGANYDTDAAAARWVLESGVPVAVVSANPQMPIVITEDMLAQIGLVDTPYARKIAATHGAAPLAGLVAAGHLKAWDELAAVYLFAPELFVNKPVGGNVVACSLPDEASASEAVKQLLNILRGKPDSESRVFYGFPLSGDLYAEDVAAMVEQTVARHGASEWRAGVLTNEMHGHLGIYATIGVKMGIRAREYFNIGVDDILVTSFAGSRPPISCMNDGLQVSTGASIGHGLITVEHPDPPRAEAVFKFKDNSVTITLKPEYARQIRDDVRKGIELYGDLTEPYWLYIRELALKYWLEFDRHTIFDINNSQ